jgi:hypothetical protein
VELLAQLGPWPAVVAILNAVALLILAINRVIREFLTYRLARRALKTKKPRKALCALAKVIEAQRGKRRGDRQRKDDPPKSFPPGHPPTPPSGSSSP